MNREVNHIDYKHIPDFVLSHILSSKTYFLGPGNWDLILAMMNGFIERKMLEKARP